MNETKPESPDQSAPATLTNQTRTPLARNPKVWCFTTYFTEGFPFAIIRMMSSVFFTDVGMSERNLGYLNILGMPWNLKFLWAPLIDIFGNKRTWMIVVQILISLLTGAVAFLCFATAHGANPLLSTNVLVMLFVVLAFIAATNDIVIDGYYMEGLTDPKEQAAYTGYRVFAYRLALILAKFGIIWAVGAIAKKAAGADMYLAWGYGFAAAALTMGIFTLYHLIALPRFDIVSKAARSARGTLSGFLTSFSTYLEVSRRRALIALLSGLAVGLVVFLILFFVRHQLMQAFAYGLLSLLAVLMAQAKPAVGLSLLFIIFYKIGDEIIFSMGTPFLKRYLLVTNTQLAWMSGLVGLFGSIAGTTVGGLWIKKKGLKKTIWPLTLLMNLNIWAYVWLAWERPLATSMSGLMTIGAVYCYEQIAAGLGNAALIVYILQTCKQEFKAGHYAIGSAFMSIFSTIFGMFSGIIVEKMGYANLFLIGFFATIPAMLLLFVVPIREKR
jgi:PAT family beta-lactamase induction signal transducer AmpG